MFCLLKNSLLLLAIMPVSTATVSGRELDAFPQIRDLQSISYCGFPDFHEGLKEKQRCSIVDEEESCNRSKFFEQGECFWNGRCTSLAEGEENICPSAQNEKECESSFYATVRKCVWREIGTMTPTQAPSIPIPTSFPTAEATTTFEDGEVPTSYCGPSGVEDPFLRPPIKCRDNVSIEECESVSYYEQIHCKWNGQVCAADTDTGDNYCPHSYQDCIGASFYTLRYCQWYAFPGDQNYLQTTQQTQAPISSQTQHPTIAPKITPPNTSTSSGLFTPVGTSLPPGESLPPTIAPTRSTFGEFTAVIQARPSSGNEEKKQYHKWYIPVIATLGVITAFVTVYNFRPGLNSIDDDDSQECDESVTRAMQIVDSIRGGQGLNRKDFTCSSPDSGSTCPDILCDIPTNNDTNV